MHSRILVPVDLAHIDKLTKALDVAATLAKGEGARVIYAGVASNEPSSVAKTPEEYDRKIKAFAEEQAQAHGIETEGRAIRAHDVTIDLSKKVIGAIGQVGADLVVMASHVPGVADHLFHSNAGKVASYAPVSVYVVR